MRASLRREVLINIGCLTLVVGQRQNKRIGKEYSNISANVIIRTRTHARVMALG